MKEKILETLWRGVSLAVVGATMWMAALLTGAAFEQGRDLYHTNS